MNVEVRERSVASETALALRGLTKRYGDFRAVDSVGLEVRTGEFVALLGPSGSGKTTTLKMIAGFEEPTAGEILVDGTRVTAPPHKRDIGMVFQNYALFPHMTAAENVGFSLKVRRVAKGETRRRVAEALEMVGLADRGGQYPKQLSGGQQQRVALARALVFRPKMVLLDEPLGALDKKLREDLQLQLKRIQRDLGVTMIYVTHDQEEALVMSDRVAVFNKGKIEQFGEAEELYERPCSVFVAGFIGESNIFRGAFLTRDGRPCCSCGGTDYAISGDPALYEEGAPTALVVRPERLRVLDAGSRPAHDENAVRATVREVIYLGSERKYLMDDPDGETLVGRHQVGTLASEPRAGDGVVACWKAEHGVVVAGD